MSEVGTSEQKIEQAFRSVVDFENHPCEFTFSTIISKPLGFLQWDIVANSGE